MTCIAYRDGIIAADTLVIIDDVVKQENEVKVVKRKGHLFGISGQLPPLDEVVKWYFSKGRKTFKNHKFTCLVVHPNGSIHACDYLGDEITLNTPFYAIGSGREFAIGAMEVGATAIQAVEAAIKWCPTVGGKVIVRKL